VIGKNKFHGLSLTDIKAEVVFTVKAHSLEDRTDVKGGLTMQRWTHIYILHIGLKNRGSCVTFAVSRRRQTNKQTPWSESASELYRPSDRRFSAKWLPTFADKGCYVVSVTDPYGSILGFLDRSRYFFYQVANQLYSRGRVDPVPDPQLVFLSPPRKSGSAGNRTRASKSVAKNTDH
jgi:hypothetical protein